MRSESQAFWNKFNKDYSQTGMFGMPVEDKK